MLCWKFPLNSSVLPFERRAVASLAALYAFRMLGLFMVLPVLSLYGDDYSESTPLLLGLALGVYGFSQALLQIPFGMLSDRWGRKPIIIFGLLMFALGSVVAAMSDSIQGLILGRCLQGAGAIASPIMALVADLTSDENRTKAMASLGASIGVSFAVALILGPLLSGWGRMDAIFWLTAVLALLGIVILVRWVPSPTLNTPAHRDAGAVPTLLLETLRKGELLRLNFGIFVLHYVLMACFVVMPLILESQLGIGRDHHWQVYLPVLILSFIVMVPFIIVAEKRRKIKPVFVFAVVLLALASWLLGQWQGQIKGFIVALFCFFVAFNMLEATLPSLMSKVAPAGAKGTASGIYSTSQFLGAFAGGVSGGWMLQTYGVLMVFSICALLVVVWVFVALTMNPPRFLKNAQVSFTGVAPEEASSKLSALPGVVEVLLIQEDQMAYLKVDSAAFDADSLRLFERKSSN